MKHIHVGWLRLALVLSSGVLPDAERESGPLDPRGISRGMN